MKTAKRVLAVLLAMLMAVSTFAIAASAAESIASQLASGNYASISQNTRESITITKDATIDLGGKILKSAYGSPAITVKNGAKVTIQNGYVEGYYKNYQGVTLDLFDDVVNSAPAGIQVSGEGSKVTLKDVRVMGGLVRIPSTTEWFIPAGSAVKAFGNAEVELDGAVLIGSYGVSNDPAGLGRSDAKVTIKEGILMGYLDYVKVQSGVNYDEATVEKVNAADRIAGFLNSNITVESYEQDIIDLAFDDRIYIFTKKPVDEDAVVTLDKNSGWAKITASEVSYTERMDGEIGVPKSTDCSYRYVPETAYDVETGKIYQLNKDYPVDELEGKTIRINYRLQFELKGDVKKVATDFDTYFKKYYKLAIAKADAVYARALTEYDKFIDKFVQLYADVSAAGQRDVEIDGTPVMYNDEPADLSNVLGDDFYFILRSLLTLGGVTVYNKAEEKLYTGEGEAPKFTTKVFDGPIYNYGAVNPGPYEKDLEHPHDTAYFDEGGNWVETSYYDVTEFGTLDRVQQIVNDFNAIKESAEDQSFADQSKWAEYAHFVLNNYTKLIGDGTAGNYGLLGEVYDKLNQIRNDINDPEKGYKDALTRLGVGDKLKLLDDLVSAVNDAKIAVDEAYKNEIVQSVKAKIDDHANDGTVETYMNKLIGAVNNYRKYFTPERFVTDDGFGKTYTVTGPTTVTVIEKGSLYVSVLGGGQVNYTSDYAPAGELDEIDYTSVPFQNAVILNAEAEEGYEFLYYVDSYSNRIISTNKRLIVDTHVERYIKAVFESVEISKVVFANTSGTIFGETEYADSISTSGIVYPTVTGYTPTGWGPKGASTLGSDDFVSAYQKGNSAFEDGAAYNIRGYAFPLNTSTQNKYLVTPKYEAATTFEVIFKDGNNVWSKTVNIGDSVSYTAQGEGFKYWRNQNNQIVSVYRSYSVQAVAPTELEAVYEGEVNATGYVNNIATMEDDTNIRIYTERSIPASYKVLAVGIIVSFTDTCTNPKVEDINNNTIMAVHTTQKTNQGVYALALKRTTLRNKGGKAYVVGYVEIETPTGSSYVYSPVPTDVHN